MKRALLLAVLADKEAFERARVESEIITARVFAEHPTPMPHASNGDLIRSVSQHRPDKGAAVAAVADALDRQLFAEGARLRAQARQDVEDLNAGRERPSLFRAILRAFGFRK